jgi:alpha-ketoglutarate-dependent taurine dioxygenase
MNAPHAPRLPLGQAIVRPEEATAELLYAHTVLVIPRTWQHCDEDEQALYDFHRRFGTPWTRAQYMLTGEQGGLLAGSDLTAYVDGSYAKLAGTSQELPWHSDVPIYRERGMQWPIRALTAVGLPPNPVTTSFVSMYDVYDSLDANERAFAEQVTLTYHSWYAPGTGWVDMPLVQRHPVTGRPFLALNSFKPGKRSDPITTHWIQGVSIAGDSTERTGAEVLGRFAERYEDLAYRHQWQPGDMVAFDNTGLLHRRDGLANLAQPRKFYRANVRHAYQTARRPAA